MLYLGHFAKLVRSTLESTRRGKITIDEEVQALKHYLSLEKLRFKDDLNYRIDIDSPIDTHDTEIPAMLIQPFVENALKHGLSTEQTAALISVHFKQTIRDFLIVDIKDNGKGVNEKAKNTENTEGVTKTGVGIALSRKRLALLNGREDSRDLVIDPILNEEGKNVGTCVRMTILIL
jgi:two-component system, LytTR family, sensor kinase